MKQLQPGDALGDAIGQTFAQLMTDIAKTIDTTGRTEILNAVRSAISHLKEATRYVTLLENEDDRIWSFTGLVWFYQGQSLWTEAEAWAVGCCKFATDHFGDRHPSTASSLNNLALLYSLMGQYDRALPLYESALEIKKSELGDRHPDTASSLNNLAILYYSTNRLPKAATMMSGAVSIFEELLGPDHPNTITVRDNLEVIQKTMAPSRSLTIANQ